MKKRGVGFKIKYHELVVRKDIPRLDKAVGLRIRVAIENKLIIYPQIFGSPLRGTLRGYWKLRVGDWRVVYLVRLGTVKIVFIGHRKEIYDLVRRRVGS